MTLEQLGGLGEFIGAMAVVVSLIYVALEIRSGSVVVFSDHMPHYSSQNFSDVSRQAFTIHVTDSDSTWSDRNWLQRRQLAPFVLG